MIDIKAILATAIENEASDVHINVGMPPVLRKNTELIDLDLSPVTNEDAKEMVLSMVGPERFKKYLENKDLDFSVFMVRLSCLICDNRAFVQTPRLPTTIPYINLMINPGLPRLSK